MTTRRASALALLCVLLAGCGPGGASSSPSLGEVGATASPQATDAGPSATPTVGGPAVTIVVDERGPIIEGTDGPAGLPYVLPAAAAVDAEGAALLITAWFGAPGQQRVTLTRSDDLRAWTLGTEPIYTDLGLSLADPGPIPQSLHRLEDGTWRLVGWGADPLRSSSLFTWVATAAQPEGPWTVVAPLALEPGPAGAWDSQTAAVSSALVDEAGSRLWYEGEPPGSSARGDIGLATSEDGLTWVKRDDPVIVRGICGPGTAAEVAQAQVERIPGGFVAVFGGRAGPREPMDVYAATSADGIAWTCSSLEPLLQAENIPGSEGIHTIQALPRDDGSIALILESLGDAASSLWLTTVEVAAPGT